MSVIIRLQNLPISANASNIRRFFVGLAIPEGGVHIVGGNDGDAFIAFATDEDARKAMLLDRQTINGAPVRLFLSSKAEMQSVIESARSSALYTGVVASQSLPSIPQKSEAMQALDVTAPTLPSSFPSYRNGTHRDTYPEARTDQFSYPGKRASPPPTRPFEPPVPDPYGTSAMRMPPRLPERSAVQEPLPPNREYDYNHQPHPPFPRYDEVRDRVPAVSDYPPPRDHVAPTNPPPSDPYRLYYEDPIYDHRPLDSRFSTHSKDISRDDPRVAYGDVHHNRATSDHRLDYDKPQTPPRPPDRTVRDGFPREPDAPRPDPAVPYPPYMPPERRPPPSYERQQPPFPDPRAHPERDFSVRPPWLNEEIALHGSKRPFQPQSDYDDYGINKKRAAPVPPAKPPSEASLLETELVVRLALPVTEVGVKSVFEILRGVHIVPKWGIRIEEDALQRPTGYIFIMVTSRESFDRALTYNGRPFKGSKVKVTQSTLDEFYRVSDPNFRLKCPPEIIKKLPPAGEPSTSPHHADGCLEVAELPPDVTRSEVVRFLGAPDLSPNDVVIAGFPPSDRTAPSSTKSVRALVILPSAEDIQILLSAKVRPLRPDGSFPPVRLTPISRQQFEAFSLLSLDKKPITEPPKVEKPSTVNTGPSESTKPPSEPPTCAYLSGLSRYLKDSEVLRLFPSVLIPGDAIRMVPPANTSAYIDFISENNCRRAVSDITGSDSKAKIVHPDIRIEPISRGEMESRLEGIPKAEEPHINDRNSRPPPVRDPRDARGWDPRTGPRPARHGSPVPFRPRSPPPARPGYDDHYYDRAIPPIPFEDGHADVYGAPTRRSRPPMDMPHPGPPPIPNDYHSPHQPLPPPGRRAVPDFVTIFVGNLPPSVTVDQLAGIMRDYYFVPGSVRIRRDIHGIPTGEALVDFNSNYDADRVIRDLNGYRIAGRPIVLHYDRRP